MISLLKNKMCNCKFIGKLHTAKNYEKSKMEIRRSNRLAQNNQEISASYSNSLSFSGRVIPVVEEANLHIAADVTMEDVAVDVGLSMIFYKIVFFVCTYDSHPF